MNAKSLMYQHVKETAELKRREKSAWNQLFTDQETALMNSDGKLNLAAQFEKEREEHNQFFAKEKADLMQKQQKELEEYKKTKERSDKGMER